MIYLLALALITKDYYESVTIHAEYWMARIETEFWDSYKTVFEFYENR